MAKSAVALTDPAMELSQLWEEFSGLPDSGTATYTVLANHFGLKEHDPAFLELLGIISGRVRRLAELIAGLNDTEATAIVKQNVATSLATMSTLIRPSQLSQPWNNVKEKYAKISLIANVQAFSAVVRPHRPLRKISTEEREDYLAKIDGAITDVESEASLSEWASSALVESLKTLRFCVEHLRLFGHTAIYEKIIIVESRTNTLQYLEDAKDDEGTERSKNATAILAKAVAVVLIGSELFGVPNSVYQNFHDYREMLPASSVWGAGGNIPIPTARPLQIESKPEQ